MPTEKGPKNAPQAPSKPQNMEDTVAPKNAPPPLVLERLEDMLRKNQITPELEKESGMSREEMEQFVQKFKGAPKQPAGKGRTIDVKPGQNKALKPSQGLPGINPRTSFSAQSVRDRGAVPIDQVRDNIEGTRLTPPSDLLPRVQAYSSTLSRTRTNNPARGSGSGGR